MGRIRTAACVVLVAVPFLLVSTPANAGVERPTADEAVTIDGGTAGRTYDGIGGVSAGASSRLLYDYPEPERSQILDYLFKPGYGASMQLLKLEIGGDTNSTDGSEASHMREPGEVNCDRGYEWWLAKEAKKRNPDITLLGLAWGAPGWFKADGIADDAYWSQDNIDYQLAWLDCADQHGLAIDYMGGWNERGYNTNWLIAFDKALAATYPDVKLVAADDCCVANNWRIADEMKTNPALREAVDVVGVHFACGHRTEYKTCSSTQAAKDLGKPLWMSENSALGHDTGGQPIARALNRTYTDAEMTGYMAWSPIAAYYANLPIADTGVMLAEWPWSGHYKVDTSIWAYAHTAQFARPGWRHLKTGSGRLGSGATVVSRAAPDSSEFSAVVEALDITAPTTLDVRVTGGLPADRLHVWATDMRSDDPARHFVHEKVVNPADGTFSITAQPGFLYTVTSLDTGGKGTAKPAAGVGEQMPLPYAEDFEGLEPNSMAKYFSDVNGAFEAMPCGAGRAGTCYRQQVTRQPIKWVGTGDMHPTTIVGDPRWWGDYEVSADVMLERPGFAELSGRISSHRTSDYNLGGYHLQFSDASGWELRSVDEYAGTHVLATGGQSIGTGTWHRVALRMDDSTLTVWLDGKQIGQVADSKQRTGNVGLRASKWTNAQFDNVRVAPVGDQPSFLPQSAMTASATSEHGFYRGYTHEAAKAVDGRPESMWHSKFAPREPLPQAITLDLGAGHNVSGLAVQPRYEYPSNGMITGYRISVSANGRDFTTVATGFWPVTLATKVATWSARADTRFVRLEAVAGVEDLASAAEINVMVTGARYR